MISGRRGVQVVMGAAGALTLLLAGCTTDVTPPPTPDPTPSATASASASPTRTVSTENLPRAADVPKLPLGGTVKASTAKARPVTKISVCEQDLDDLAATSRAYASYRQQAPEERKTPLTGQPTVYVLALQFASPTAARQAQQTWKSWLDTCRYDIAADTGFASVERGFDWQPVPAPPGVSEVAEIAYRPRGATTDANYWESTGLTLVEDRLAVTVHLFYALEDLFNLDPNDDEGGYRHPQLRLTRAAAEGLTR